MIVPDGPLEFVPFEMFPVAGAGALIEKCEVIQSPSAAVALALARRREQSRQKKGGILLVADPVFDSADPRLGAHASASRERSRFARLAFSRREAQTIAALRPPMPVTTLLDFDASKEAFASARLADYDLLNIYPQRRGGSRYNPIQVGFVAF